MLGSKTEWENGEITFEPLENFIKDYQEIVAEYGAKNGLLDLDGWKQFKPIARREKKSQRIDECLLNFLLWTGLEVQRNADLLFLENAEKDAYSRYQRRRYSKERAI